MQDRDHGSRRVAWVIEKRGWLPPTREDRAWTDYLRESPRSDRDFISLLSDPDIEPVFKQRALQVLFSPDLRDLPFSVPGPNSENFLYNAHFNLKGLPDGYVSDAGRVVLGYLKDSKAKAKAKAGEASGPDGFRFTNIWADYNNLVVELLERTEGEDAEALFAEFSVTDPASNYIALRPLEHLLYSQVDEQWKKRALGKVHDMIREEQKDDNPDHHEVTSAYSTVLERMVDMSQLYISREIFQEEIEFLLRETKAAPVEGRYTFKALSLLKGDETRHEFVRRQALDNESGDRYRTYGEYDIPVAKALLEEFSDDPELAKYLQDQIKEAELVGIRMERERVEREKREKRVLDALRVKH